MKLILKIAGVLLAVMFLCGMFVSLFRGCQYTPNPDVGTEESTGDEFSDSVFEDSVFEEGTKKTYTITYKVIAQGYVVDIPEDAFRKGKSYPTSYTEGETVVLDDPVSSYFYDSYNQYEFRGWYLDEACTIPFDGETVANSNQDVTIYAKTKWYLWSPTV